MRFHTGFRCRNIHERAWAGQVPKEFGKLAPPFRGEDVSMKYPAATRRDVLRMAGAGVVTALASRRLWAAADTARPMDPDVVVYNAKVYTLEPGLAASAEAFAVKQG